LREARRSGHGLALLLMDLNQFKEVNDQLGHHHGDRLLAGVAARLRDSLRECDTVARLGGDEFALLLTDGSGVVGARAVAQKVLQCLSEPFDLDGMAISARASIGIALSPDHGDDDESLLRRADIAMYKAKRAGGGVAVYDHDAERSNAHRLTLANDLERAIESGELRLAYQPILDVVTRRVTRVEALVRWQHPSLGLLPPKEFVDLAALSGMIRPLTDWVIDRSLRQAADWRSLGIELDVSVNLSMRNLFETELPALIVERLRTLDLPGRTLTVEISESELMDDPRAALEAVGTLRSFGVRTSIDDFGTGASSLGRLQDLPISEIKIDRSFVAKLDGPSPGSTVVRSITDLGRNLGIDVVAEGVQSADALTVVTQLGCQFAQGYHIGPPMSAGAVGLVAAATQEPSPMIDIRDEIV
jgi:diguanylate cyclase (GGDEF)-like protein